MGSRKKHDQFSSGGIIAALIGSVLTVSTWILGAAPHPWLRGLGTAFLILTIPLLIVSGYCLDWMERDRNKSDLGEAHSGEQRRVLH